MPFTAKRVVTYSALVIFLMSAGIVHAATSFTMPAQIPDMAKYTVQMSAEIQESPLQVNLEWAKNPTVETTVLSYVISRKRKDKILFTDWVTLATVSSTTLSYSDTNPPADILTGTTYEYQVQKNISGASGFGYMALSKNIPIVDNRGTVILIVENNAAATLASKITRLKNDLAGDGWSYIQHNVASTSAVTDVKALIVTDYTNDPTNVKAVFLFGRVPVPYSGDLVPDGHTPEHRGAWPADVYYGEMNSTWTDTTINRTTSTFTGTRNNNSPGDGKFDQSTIPSDVELQVGRVDMYDLPAFAPLTEMDLLSRYLDKDHDYRIASTTAQYKTIIHDGFGTFSGSAFSISGWRNFAAIVSPTNIEEATSLNDYINKISGSSYIWSYANGANAATDYVTNPVYNVFGMNFISYEGDWDYTDNVMRASIAGAGYALTSGWAGRPHWFLHHMGLGENIGYSFLRTQNNTTGSPYKQINAGAKQVHVALMGDPTLRMYILKPVTNLGSSLSNGRDVTLTWTAPAEQDILGYHVYRKTGPTDSYQEINSSLVTGTSYTLRDMAGTWTYMVRGEKLSTTTSGSFYNLTPGMFVDATVPDVDAPPFVTTEAATSLLDVGATLNGTITDAGGHNATVRGFQYGLDTSYGTTASESGDFSEGSYGLTVSGLTSGVTYHYRSFATNITGTEYGEDKTFTTLVYSPPTVSISGSSGSYTTISLSGSIDDIGNNPVTTRGFVYGTSVPYTATSTESGTFDVGGFSQDISSLTPDTLYHFTVFAANSTGITYGTDQTVSTIPFVVPTVGVPSASSVSYTSTTLNGSIDDTGGQNATVRGFVYGTSDQYTATSSESGSFATGSFSLDVSGLTSATTYHFAAFATGPIGTTYSTDQTFDTLTFSPPTISVPNSSNVLFTTASLQSSIDDTGGQNATVRGFVYGRGSDGVYTATSSQLGIFGTGTFSADLTGLVSGVTYSYTSFAQNSHGIVYSTNQTFDTQATPAQFVSTQTGDWNLGTTWGGSCTESCLEGFQYPGASTPAVIADATVVTVTEDGSVQNLEIASGGTLDLGTHSLAVHGSFTNDGTFTPNTGGITFAGTSNLVYGSNTFYDMAKSVNSASSLTFGVHSTTTVSRALTLSGARGNLLSLSARSDATSTYSLKWGTLLNDVLSNNASGMAVSQTTGHQYIADCAGSHILELDSDGNFVRMWGESGNGKGQFNCPEKPAIGPGGVIYVTDKSNNRIQKFDSSGNFLSMFGWGVKTESSQFEVCTSADTECFPGIAGDYKGQLDNPEGLTVDASGNIYVADYNNNRIQKFDSSGDFVAMFGWGVLDDSSAFQVCVASDPSCQIGHNGSGMGQFNQPTDVVIDSNNDIHVLDANNYRIQKFNGSTYAFIRMIGWGVKDGGPALQTCVLADGTCELGLYGTGKGQLDQSTFMAIDANDALYVSEYANRRVQQFNSFGAFVRMFGWGVQDGTHEFQVCESGDSSCQAGITGSGIGQFTGTKGIGLDSSGNIYVVDMSNQRTQKFTSEGALVSGYNMIPAGMFVGPSAIASDVSGNVYVGDCGSAVTNISKFDSSGNMLMRSGHYGVDNGGFQCPQGMAVDSQNNIYISDSTNRVVEFSSAGAFVKAFGWGVLDGSDEFQICTATDVCQAAGTSDAGGALSDPKGIVVSPSGHIFVGEAGHYRVQEFDANGAFVKTFGWGVKDGTSELQVCTAQDNLISPCVSGISGSGKGQMTDVPAIAVDSSGRIYVASNVARIQQFDSSGNFLAAFGWGVKTGTSQFEICSFADTCYAGSAGSGRGQLNSPAAIKIDSAGNIYVAENNNYRIQKFDSSFNYLSQFGSHGSEDAQFDSLGPIALDTTGNIYAIDGNIAQIKKFVPNTIAHWYLNPQGTVSASYLSVTNSTNVGPTITCTDCVDGGGNTGWIFVSSLSGNNNSSQHSGGSSGSSVGGAYLVQNPLTNQQEIVPTCPKGFVCTRIFVAPSVLNAQPFTRSLALGSVGPDVAALQRFLNSHGYRIAVSGPGSAGRESNTFGELTRAALARFQKDQKISPSVGYFGPRTMEVINKLLKQSVVPLKPITPVTTLFTKNLSVGDVGQDVLNLQKYLNSHGFIIASSGPGSPGYETTSFGPQTEKALKKFQASNGLPSTGYFGPQTRSFINSR